MNQTFKVVFNKARGALMVVNEVTSSVQAKGTKTVIAAAVAALVAGGAVAADTQWEDAPEGLESVTDATWDTVKPENKFVWAPEGEQTAAGTFLSTNGKETFEGKLWVSGDSKAAQATGLAVSGADGNLTNAGTIYVTSGKNGVSYQNKGIWAGNGATATNAGVIVAKNAYGMTVGTEESGANASKIVNKGTIYVEETGVGMELGGVAKSEAENHGTIVVGTPKTGEDVDGGSLRFGHGVLIKDTSNNTFTNYGTIEAAKDATAIEIQVSNGKTTASNTINLEKGSSVNGLIHNHANVSGTTLKANGFVGTIDLQNDSTSGMTIEVNQGANLTLADGHGSKALTAVVNDGMLSASIWQKYTVGEGEEAKDASDNQFTNVTVNEGGIFNVTKLNSTWAVDDPSTPDVDESKVPAGAAKDQLLIKGATYKLDGGKLYAEGAEWHGNVKVGTLNGAVSGLSLENGDYDYAKMTVGTDSTLTVTDSANVTLDSLHVYNQGTGSTGGAVTINNGASVTVDDIKFEDATGKLTLADGTLNTTVANLLDETGALKANYTLTSGTLGIDGAFDITKASAFQNVTVVADEAVAMVDGQAVEITTTKNEDLSTNVKDVNAVGGLVYGTATLQATEANEADASIHVNSTLAGVQKIEILNDKVTNVALDADFRLVGDGSELVVGSNEKSEFNIGTNTLTLGTTADGAKGGAYAGTVKGEGKLAVDGGEFKLGAVDVGTMTVNNTSDVTVNTLKVTSATVDGYLFASTIQAGSMVTSESLVGFQTLEAGATVQANGSDVYIAAAAKDAEGKDIAQVQGTVNLDGDSYLTTNTSAALDSRIDSILAMDSVKYVEDTDAVAYIDQSILVGGEKGAIFLGNVGGEGVTTPSVKLGSQSVTIINAANFMQTGATVFAGADLTVGSSAEGTARVVLDNLLSKGSLKLAENIIDPVSGQALISTNLFLDAAVDAENAGTVAVTFNRDAVAGNGELADAIDEVLIQGGDRDDQSVINAIGQYDAFLNEAGTALNARGEQAAEEYLALPVTAGTYNVAYDAAEQVTGTIQRRNLEPTMGMGVWADVFYSTNEAKKIYGGQGYSADIYGGTIGFDGTFSCGAKLGLALSVGSGDADSKKSVSDFSNDADFWGVSVYTGKDIAGLYFSADASYLAFDNDIKGSVAGASADESIDSSVFTVGVRADMTVYDKAFKVVPHVGVRYTKIDVDDYRGLEADSMNVFETPVGVKVAGAFEPAAGWKLTPSFDFTIVPQLGDKDVNTLVGDVDVLDNVYNTTLGVNASYGNFTFGLSYRYGFGTDDRSNNAFQARAAYAF